MYNSDINLNGNNSCYQRYSNDSIKLKRQKSNKYRVLPESSSLLSIPSLISSATLTNESTMSLIGSGNQLTKRLYDETAGDADDEKDARDEIFDMNRYYRYHRMQEQCITSEEDEDVLSKNHRGMMDFMDRVSFLK